MAAWQVALVAGGVPLLLGGVFLAIGLLRVRMTRTWQRTEGIVVDKRTGRADGGMPALYPTVQWQGPDGRVHQQTSSVRQSLGPPPGRRVPLLVDPARPDRAVIDSFVQSGRIFTVIGTVLAAVGILVGAAVLSLAGLA